MIRMTGWLLAFGVAAGYGPAWAQEREEERKQEGEKREEPAPKKRDGDRPREGERKEVDRPREGERPVRRDGDREEGERPVRRDGDRREGEKPPVRRDGERREGERPVQRDGDRPREGERREVDRPRDGERAREGDRPREGERPVRRDGDPRPARGEEREVEKPAPAEPPIPVDEKVAPKSEPQPSYVGRVQSVFKDGVNTLLTLKVPGRTPSETSVQMQAATTVSYYGLEKPQEQPTVGYLAYVWLKPGSTDVASAVRFTAEKK